MSAVPRRTDFETPLLHNSRTRPKQLSQLGRRVNFIQKKKKEFTIRNIKFKKKKKQRNMIIVRWSLKRNIEERYDGLKQNRKSILGRAGSIDGKKNVRGLLSSLERFPWCSSNVANHRSLARIGLRVRDLFRHGMTLPADRSFEQSCLSSLARLKPPSTPSFSRLEQQNCVCPRVDRELNPGD